jgi:hypothetical protein
MGSFPTGWLAPPLRKPFAAATMARSVLRYACLFFYFTTPPFSHRRWSQAPSNDPGPRQNALAVIDASDHIWWMTGNLAGGTLNDVWKFDTKTLLWTWFVRPLADLVVYFHCSSHLRVNACQDGRNEHA